ncbi:hypothetical protein [Actinomadura macra]|uniref:hypothetical protein n=1 Tax=Actinomadura macra TaxID=46164 RepID=UPI00082B0BA3|nr:hypothetical protein [Actinomadura macra]
MSDEIRDKLKPKAIELRRQGWTYREIAGSLDISISICSLWLRDLPRSPRKKYSQQRAAAMWNGHWVPFHARRERERRETKLAACQEVGQLTERDVLIAGAVAYRCEGSKDKAHRRSEMVAFINSDPALIVLFLHFLDVAGVSLERLRLRLHIHETADREAATEYWSALAGITADRFQKPVIKRHKPKTLRKNTSVGYRGCLEVRVLDSADLYRRIEGWAHGAILGAGFAEVYLTRRSQQAERHILRQDASDN